MAFDCQISEGINSATRIDFKGLVESALDHAPSDASCEAFLLQGDAGPYRASVRINCQEVAIESRQSCDSVNALLHSVKNDLYQQIRQWRANRQLDTEARIVG